MEQKNNFVSQEIAKALKDLGFDTPCLAWWFEEGTVSVPTETRRMWDNWNQYATQKRMSAPLIQQAFAWLREKHKILYAIEDIEVRASNTVGYRFRFIAWKLMDDSVWVQDHSLLGYLHYEEAEIACLKAIIKHIQNEKVQS